MASSWLGLGSGVELADSSRCFRAAVQDLKLTRIDYVRVIRKR